MVEVLPRVLPVEDEEISAFAHKAVREARHQDPHRRHGQGAEEGHGQRHRHDRERRQDRGDHGRAGDHGGRHRRQRREPRPRGHRGEGRARPHRHRPLVPHRRARRLRHRRRGRRRPGSRTRPATRACSASRRSPASSGVHPLDVTKIPGCTYCTPQVASVGLTEKAAKDAGYEVKVGRFPFIGNGKAIALGEPEGMVKTVFDAKTGELLGAHMVGAEVTELIQGYVIARTMEATEEDLFHTIFPHPTLSEMMHEAALDAYGAPFTSEPMATHHRARPHHASPRKPAWIRVKAPTSAGYHDTRRLMRDKGLHTVCEEAACPNIGECWTQKHATVMILGDTCTRACAFCNVKTGMPRAVDPHEPAHLAEVVADHGPGARRHHLGRPRRPAGRRCLPVRALHRGDPARHARHHDRDPDPRLPAQAGCGRGDRRGPARRLQPQSRDRAAALPHRPARVPATSTPCACCSRSRSSTRRCSPSPGSWWAWARRSARSIR